MGNEVKERIKTFLKGKKGGDGSISLCVKEMSMYCKNFPDEFIAAQVELTMERQKLVYGDEGIVKPKPPTVEYLSRKSTTHWWKFWK